LARRYSHTSEPLDDLATPTPALARSWEIIRLRFEEDLTQREIGELVGCSQMHVSRILRDALRRLREPPTTPGWSSTDRQPKPASAI
jgi:DNA-directed RNA polymerase specialized sigma24 family protein